MALLLKKICEIFTQGWMDAGRGDKKLTAYVNEKYTLSYIGIIIVCYLVRRHRIINASASPFSFVK